MEAVERYGMVRGGRMATWRLLRCHPLAKGGLDAVVKDGAGCGVNGDGASPVSTREMSY